MIALNPIKKDELSHTEPKLRRRRRQIETPTVSNNVEEIPDATEKLCPFPQTPGWRARSRRWRALSLCRTPARTRVPAPLRSVAHSSNLLSNDHLWHSHQPASAETFAVFNLCGEAPGRLSTLLSGHKQTESRHTPHLFQLSAWMLWRRIRCL